MIISQVRFVDIIIYSFQKLGNIIYMNRTQLQLIHVTDYLNNI